MMARFVDAVETARVAAAREIGDAQIVSVQVVLSVDGAPVAYETSCIHERRSLLGRTTVRACHVTSRLDGVVTRTSPQNGFVGSIQDLTATHRVPPPFGVDRLVVEPTVVLNRLAEDPVIPWRPEAGEHQLGVAAWRTGAPEWHAQYGVEGLGSAGVFVTADTGVVAFEQLHVAHVRALSVTAQLSTAWELSGNAIDTARRLAQARGHSVPGDARIGPIATCRVCGDVLAQLWRPGDTVRLAVASARHAAGTAPEVTWTMVTPDVFVSRFVSGGEHLSDANGSQPSFGS